MQSRRSISGAAVVVLLCAAVCSLVLATPAVAVAADVSVGGRISADTTWTAGTTYRLADRVQVPYGVRLRIEPGARIEGNGKTMEVFGALEAAGTAGSRVVIRNLHLKGLGISALPSLFETFTIDVAHADVDGGSLQGGGGAMYGSWSLTDSVVSNTTDAMYLWFPEADCTISGNAFINAGRISCGVSEHSVAIENNLFYRTRTPVDHDDGCIDNWAAYGDGTVEVHNNSFMNPGDFTISVPQHASSVPKMNATGNYWGTTDVAKVEAMIFDRDDDLASPGTVPFLPMLSSAPSHWAAPLATSLSFAAGPTVPSQMGSVKVSGSLTDARQAPLAFAPVEVRVSTNGVDWKTTKTVRTDAKGLIATTVAFSTKTSVLLFYAGQPGAVSGSTASAVAITPRASLTRPTLSKKRPVRKRYFTASGYLKPSHVVGQRSVTLQFYRRERVNGKLTWRLRKRVTAKNYRYLTYTKYSVRTRLSSRGRWRVQAIHSDPEHARTVSTWRYFTVR